VTHGAPLRPPRRFAGRGRPAPAGRSPRPGAFWRLPGCFTAGYRRVVLDGVGHFPHREDVGSVADLVDGHLRAHL
jgi:pimeloyl-ACP methyl ester carboxylesterase